MIVFAPASALAVGSWLGVALGLGASAAFVFRAAGEDRFLQANLSGYREYSARVRSRIIPGVW